MLFNYIGPVHCGSRRNLTTWHGWTDGQKSPIFRWRKFGNPISDRMPEQHCRAVHAVHEGINCSGMSRRLSTLTPGLCDVGVRPSKQCTGCARYAPCTGHTGCTGRILYTRSYDTPSKGPSNCTNVNEKHAPSPSGATANTHRPSNCTNCYS